MVGITLSQLRAFTGEHLAEAAMHWDRAAEAHSGVYGIVHTEAHGLDWEGKNHAASMEQINNDYQTVKNNSASFERAAQIARQQASTLSTMARHVTHYADEITEGGEYTVSEDLQVLFPPTRNVQEYIRKTQEADKHQATLQARAGNFVTHRWDVATDLIQAVDNCLTPDQIRSKLWHDAVKGAIPGGIAGGVALGPIGILTGGAAGAIGNDTGDLIDIINGATRVCNDK